MGETAHTGRGFAAGALCIVLTFTAAALSVPLYGVFADELGIARTDLTFVTVSYFVGTVASLLFFARLSDYCGRKPLVCASLLISVAGCLVLCDVHVLAQFCLGRFLHGTACGIAMGSAGSYVLDNAQSMPLWVPSAINTSGSQIGFALGAFVAAGIVTAGLGTALGFLGIAALELACAAALVLCPETVPRKSGALKAVRPQLMMPKAVRPILLVCCCAWCATWGLGGFYQTFSFSLGPVCFQNDSIVFAALPFALYMAVGMIGSIAAGRFKPLTSQKIGMALLVANYVLVAIAVVNGLGALLVFACVAGGIAHGMAYAGALQRALARTTEAENAGTLSSITLLSYGGAALPNLTIGIFGTGIDLITIVTGYLILVSVLWLVTFALGRPQGEERS